MFKIIVKVKVKNSTATFNISVFSVVSFLIKMREGDIGKGPILKDSTGSLMHS